MNTNDDPIKEAKKKLENVVNVATEKVFDGIQWGLDNPEKVIAGITVIAGLVKASQSLVVSHHVKMERKRIDYTYYDPSTGFHWDLARKATNNDRAEILRRKRLGEDTYDILRSLRLIK